MTKWNIDPVHTAAGFSVRHMMITTVRGQFMNVNGWLEIDPDHPENTTLETTIDVNSMAATGNEDRDKHLLSPDFLDVEKYPVITFKSTEVKVTGENTAELTGDLTIRDVTRPVKLDVEYLGQGMTPNGSTVSGFVGSTKINREEFNLTWNVALETGGWLVGKEIKIDLDVQVVLAEETEAAS